MTLEAYFLVVIAFCALVELLLPLFIPLTPHVEVFADVAVRGLGELRRLGTIECGLITIFGDPKTGKSLLLNKLTKSCQFGTDHRTLRRGLGRAGIALSHPIALDKFMNMVPTSARRGSTMALVFADIMGPGSSHDLLAHDTDHLVTALFRLSSVLIFNWMERFHVHTILRRLGLFTCTVNRLQEESGESRRLCFLHVVLRDINQTTLDDLKMRNLLLGEEPTSNPGSVERNDIRAILNAAFSKIFVWTMPFPFSETDSTQTSPLFTKKIHNLRKSLAFQINQQSDHGLEALTGSSIADKLPSLLNSAATSSIWKDMTVMAHPKEWEPQTHKIHLADVRGGSDEFDRVQTLFHKTMPYCRIVRLQRIQRRDLWSEYQTTRNRMHLKNKGKVKDDEMEMELFHGTRTTKPKDIYLSDRGFDMRYASQGLWGRGCYFSENASYSHLYSHQAEGSNLRQMFLAKVLTGNRYDDAPLDHQRTKPEPLPHPAGDEDIQYMYDSLNGITNGTRVHVIFDNGHAYPYYLITYE